MVGRLFAVAGLCGVGKSTAVRILAGVTGGDVVYFGATVLRAVRERGLDETSENEQRVRIELRKQDGDACLAIAEADLIRSSLAAGRSVFVDAVYVAQEFVFLSQLVPDAKFSLIGIEAPFVTRLERLQIRPLRPLKEPQLRQRDAVEMKKLNTGDVLAKAAIRIKNDSSMAEFEAALRRVL